MAAALARQWMPSLPVSGSEGICFCWGAEQMSSSPPTPPHLRIAVVADRAHAAQRLVSALSSPQCAARPFSLSAADAPRRVREMRPSVILIRAGDGSLGAAGRFAQATRSSGAALVLLTPHASAEALRLATAEGAMAHLLEPVTPQALLAAVTVSNARAQDYRELQQAVLTARQSADVRAVVEEAKRVLMGRFGLTEEEAHRILQTESRSRNRKLIETAEQVLRAETRFARARGSASSWRPAGRGAGRPREE